MPATFGAIYRALEVTFETYDDEIESVLDIGAGTGSASLAINSKKANIRDYTMCERDENMLKIAQELMKDIDPLNSAKWLNLDIRELVLDRNYDLIICGYSLNELSIEERQKVLENLWKHTNKLLVIVEPGTPKGYSQIVEERAFLIENGGSVVAPCSGNEACPINPKEDWCAFSTRIQRTKLHKMIKEADVPYEDEKFSFIAVSKKPVNADFKRVIRHPIIESR